MKKLTISLLAMLPLAVMAQTNTLREVRNEAFTYGEKLEYRVHYGIIDAGTATMEVKKDPQLIGGRNCYHIIGSGKSASAFDWFFKVRDKYQTFMDENALVPWAFLRDVDEGGFKIKQNVVFRQYAGKATSDEKEYDVPVNVQDILSAFYYARSLDFSKAAIGDTFGIVTFLDNEIWPMKIKYMGKETIKTGAGTFECLKFHPMVQAGRVFKEEDDMTLWVTADQNHVPVRLESEVLVGSIKMDLKTYSGLANPLTAKK